jgi:hypothetical protein
VLGHQGWPRWPPPYSGGLLAGPGLLPWWCLAQILHEGGAFAWFLVVEFALHFLVLRLLLIFHMYQILVLQNMIFSNTSGIMSIVKAYISKDCLFLLFWTLFGGRIRSIVTANKGRIHRRGRGGGRIRAPMRATGRDGLRSPPWWEGEGGGAPPWWKRGGPPTWLE